MKNYVKLTDLSNIDNQMIINFTIRLSGFYKNYKNKIYQRLTSLNHEKCPASKCQFGVENSAAADWNTRLSALERRKKIYNRKTHTAVINK